MKFYKFLSKKAISLLALLLCFCLLPNPAHAWSYDGHRLVTEFALIDVIRRYGLDRPVEVTALGSFLKKFYEAAIDSGRFRRLSRERNYQNISEHAWFKDFLRIHPDIVIDYGDKDEKIGMKIRPVDILIRHANDPDDGRDQNLNIRKYQKIFGGTEGPNSQAFRHMEKPALTPFNWRSTLGLPFGKAGEASDRAHLYFDLARAAKDLGEEYWMWRFLACGFHYMEDLAQPYHTTEISSRGRIWGQARKIHLRWKTGKKFRDIMSNLVTNSHHWFESYSAALLKNAREDYLAGRTDRVRSEISSLFEALRGASQDATQGSIRKYSVKIRNISNRRAPDLLEAVFFLTGDRLRGTYEYNQDEGHEVAPLEFVNLVKDETFQKYEARYFQLVSDSYRLAGESLRTAVDELEESREERSLTQLVDEIIELR